MLSPPLKRKRTDSGDPTPSQGSNGNYERSQLVYFDDGNIVLVAEKVAFRVHRGQLAHHSEIFRDMFAFVTQPGDAEAFDGCPVVQMAGDTSADLEVLLKTLYLFEPLTLNSPISHLEAVLRLSTKYIIEVPRKHAFDLLSLVCPNTLTKWDARPHRISDPISIIKLARTAGADILLPAAFYDLCSGARGFSDVQQLGMDALRAYYRGRDILWELWAMFILDEVRLEQACGHPSCDAKWSTFFQVQQQNLVYDCPLHIPRPLERLKAHQDMLAGYDLCLLAKTNAQERCESKRKEIWSILPDIFGLGNWDALSNLNVP